MARVKRIIGWCFKYKHSESNGTWFIRHSMHALRVLEHLPFIPDPLDVSELFKLVEQGEDVLPAEGQVLLRLGDREERALLLVFEDQGDDPVERLLRVDERRFDDENRPPLAEMPKNRFFLTA